MRTILTFSFAVGFAIVAGAAPVPKNAGKNPWVGKPVFQKASKVMLYTVENGDESTQEIDSASFIFTVAKVTAERIEIVQESTSTSSDVPAPEKTIVSYFLADDVLPSWEAIKFYTAKLQTQPQDTFLLAARAWAYDEERQAREAEADYTTLIDLEPTVWFHRYRRAEIRIDRKRYAEALEDLDEVLAASPTYESAKRKRARVLVNLKKFDEAIAEYTRMLENGSDKTAPRLGRAMAYDRAGQYQKSLADLNVILESHAENATALTNKAWILATASDAKIRDGKKSVELATKACELTKWANAGYLDTLAAAYAEVGDFENAVRWQMEAVRGKELQNQEDTEIKQRLELYQQKKAFHRTVEKQ